MRITGDYSHSDVTRFAEDRLGNLLKRLDFVCASRNGQPDDAAWFHAMPDFSPSLNEARIREGLPVGGILGWPDQDIAPAALPANGCGILVARLAAAPGVGELLKSVAAFIENPPSLDSHSVIWDAGRKNHFLNVYRDADNTHYLVLHCSAPEMKGLAESLGRSIRATPYGSISLFEGDSAKQFWARAKAVERFGLEKRDLICQAVAPGCEVIFNRPHMELVDPQRFALGCYASLSPISNVPIMVAPGQPALLVDCLHETQTQGGAVYAVPHGTGNAMSRPGAISYIERHSTFIVQRDEIAIYDLASQVFDSFPTLDEMGDRLSPWTDVPDARLRRLSPVMELKLHKGNR